MSIKKFAVLFAHGLVGWGLCGSIIGIFRNITSMENTLIIHAIGVPIIFGLLAWLYFSKFNYTTPLQTAAFFFLFAILMDFFVIAIFVEKSFAMFASILGTWIPFALIFLVTYLVGTYKLQRKRQIA
jgi:hypothetical protein